MMAETAAWGAPSKPPTHLVDDDTWHVALAPGEVKVVSLEQLDDLFRLSLVDSETKVWQVGMDEWLPLGVVAGIDHGIEPELPTRPMNVVPRPSAPPVRRAPPPPRPKSVAPVASLPPAPVMRRPPMPAPHIATAPWPPTPAPPALRVVTAAWPPAPAPLLSVPAQTLRPVVAPSFYPSYSPPAAARTSGFGRFVILVTLLAGVGVTLYRNGVLREAAHSIGQDARYAELEARIGGPAFGTPRAVEANTNAVLAAAPEAQPAIPTVAHDSAALAPATTPHAADTVTPSSAPVVSLESLRPEAVGVTPTLKSEPKKAVAAAAFVSEPVAKPQAKAAAPSPKAAPLPKAAPSPKAAPAPKAAPPPKAEADMSPKERLNAAIEHAIKNPSSSSKKSSNLSTGLKGTSSEYDPLNPKL